MKSRREEIARKEEEKREMAQGANLEIMKILYRFHELLFFVTCHKYFLVVLYLCKLTFY